jgi:hypothetical protein
LKQGLSVDAFFGFSSGKKDNDSGYHVGMVGYMLSRPGGFDGLGFAAISRTAKTLLLERKSFWTGAINYTCG